MTNIHNIAVIAGDGLGKEVVPEGIKAIEAALPDLHFELSDGTATSCRLCFLPQRRRQTVLRRDT